MRGKRMRQTLRLYLTLSVGKRTRYLKEKQIFASMGENCSIMDRKIPLYAKLIRIGNNVHVASNVTFITHDLIHAMINGNPRYRKDGPVLEHVGCIDIGDNVFIGSKSAILGDVKIGSNVIIGAGALVTHDIPDNSVAVGIPAKVVGSVDDFVARKREVDSYPREIRPQMDEVGPELAEWCWKAFEEKRKKD